MSFLTKLRSGVGTIARTHIRRAANESLAASEDCRTAQTASLRRLMALNADSEFGRRHDLAGVTSPADLRDRLPICDYEVFRPWIDRVVDGDHRAFLGCRNQLLMFSLTSGTTAATKRIPISRPFLDDYRRGWQTWGIRMLDDHFAINHKNIVQLISDFDLSRTPCGTPCGNISGLVGVMQKKIVRLMYTLPLSIMKITNSEAKAYTTIRLALNDRDVGLMTTANPSTLVHLARLLDERKEQFVRDVRDGTLCDELDVDVSMRRRLGKGISTIRKRRARELERAIARDGKLTPRGAWPQLELLAVWTGGSCSYYLNRLRELYGNLPVRDHGLHASEGRMTIPLADETPSGVLDVTSHYFEFVPAEEHGTANPTVLEAHELEEGGEYAILLTTASGLCRYDIQDIVRCTGFHGSTPCLEFLHKGAHMASITGEKLSESQVVEAFRTSLDGTAHLGDFTVSPVWGDPPGYRLLVERRTGLDETTLATLAARVDAHLRELNIEYHEKRGTGRLAPMDAVVLEGGTWLRYARARQQCFGSSSEQYKHPCLVPDLEFAEKLLAFQASPTAEPPMPTGSRPPVRAPHLVATAAPRQVVPN